MITSFIIIFCIITLLSLVAITYILCSKLKSQENSIKEIGTTLESKIKENEEATDKKTNDSETRITNQVNHINETFITRISQIANSIDTFKENQHKESIELRESLDKKVGDIRESVNETLNKSIRDSVSASFEQVSKNLSTVQTGLGEVKNIANDLIAFRNLLSNVKQRGTWAEMQLKNILDDIMPENTYEENFHPSSASKAVVEFAIKLPGSEKDKPVYLPIDSKFTKESYERLVEQTNTNTTKEQLETYLKKFETDVKNKATEIQKYINSPITTDYAIMFVPTEGIYTEILKRPGLTDAMFAKHVIPAGPTTITAILQSVRLCYQTIAINENCDNIRNALSDVSKELIKFTEVIDKVEKNTNATQNHINDLKTRVSQLTKVLNKNKISANIEEFE